MSKRTRKTRAGGAGRPPLYGDPLIGQVTTVRDSDLAYLDQVMVEQGLSSRSEALRVLIGLAREGR